MLCSLCRGDLEGLGIEQDPPFPVSHRAGRSPRGCCPLSGHTEHPFKHSEHNHQSSREMEVSFKTSMGYSKQWICLALLPVVSANNSYVSHNCDQVRGEIIYLSSQSEGHRPPGGRGMTVSGSMSQETSDDITHCDHSIKAGPYSLKPALPLLTSACKAPPPQPLKAVPQARLIRA